MQECAVRIFKHICIYVGTYVLSTSEGIIFRRKCEISIAYGVLDQHTRCSYSWFRLMHVDPLI